MLAILLVSTVLAFVLGYMSREIAVEPSSYDIPAVAASKLLASPTPQELNSLSRTITMKLVAADSAGNGAMADLVSAMTPGSGYTWIRVDRASPLINPDTQTSLRNAVDIVRDLLNMNLTNVDFYYGIVADSNLVGGRSAGAAIAVSTIALVRNESLRNDTLITGTVETDGRIGVVGMILPKATVAKANGYKLLLVPVGEGNTTKQNETCSTETTMVNGVPYKIQQCHSVSIEVEVSHEVGIEVREVSTVMEAYGIMKVK
jgi:predicted S18 family serine protease